MANLAHIREYLAKPISDEEKLKRLKTKELKLKLGTEINSFPIHVLSDSQKAAYDKCFRTAKEKNPEIWDSTPQDLPEVAFYDNRDFFEWYFLLEAVAYIQECYPDQKSRIVEVVRKYGFAIMPLYEYLKWYIAHNDFLLDFSKLCKRSLPKKI